MSTVNMYTHVMLYNAVCTRDYTRFAMYRVFFSLVAGYSRILIFTQTSSFGVVVVVVAVLRYINHSDKTDATAEGDFEFLTPRSSLLPRSGEPAAVCVGCCVVV